MYGIRFRIICLLNLLFLLLPPLSATEKEKLQIAYYQGMFTKTNLGDIILNFDTHNKQSFINIFAVSKLFHKVGKAKIEAEGQMGWHTGVQKHMEFNGLFLARFPTNNRIPLTFAFGEGISLATYNPDLENPRRTIFQPKSESEYSSKLLNFLAFEIELSLPKIIGMNVPKPFFRIHHRSGVYGLFCPPTCGSNYLSYGLRWNY